MMIEINGKEYELHFGFDFIAALNDVYFMEVQGIKFHSGLSMAMVGIVNEEPEALLNIILAGLSTAKAKPARVDIEKYLIDYAEEREDGLNGLFAEFYETLKKQPLLKGKIQKMNLNTAQ